MSKEEPRLPNNLSRGWLLEALRPKYVLFGSIVGLAVVGEVSISSRLSLFVVRHLNGSVEQGAVWVACFFLSLFLGRLMIVFWSPPISNWRLLQILALATSGFYILGLAFEPVFLVICGFTVAPFFPVAMTLATEQFEVSADLAISTRSLASSE